MPLHIVIDVRRVRDFGIGTYIRNLTRAPYRHWTPTAISTPKPHIPTTCWRTSVDWALPGGIAPFRRE